MNSDTPQQFTLAARDESLSFTEIQELIKNVLSATTGARLVDTDPKSRITVIDVPSHLVGAVSTALGRDFIVDPNAPLTY